MTINYKTKSKTDLKKIEEHFESIGLELIHFDEIVEKEKLWHEEEFSDILDSDEIIKELLNGDDGMIYPRDDNDDNNNWYVRADYCDLTLCDKQMIRYGYVRTDDYTKEQIHCLIVTSLNFSSESRLVTSFYNENYKNTEVLTSQEELENLAYEVIEKFNELDDFDKSCYW